MLVQLPRWGEAEMVNVAAAERLSTWRECDFFVREGPADVSLDVAASSQPDARQAVRAVLGPLPPDAFLASA